MTEGLRVLPWLQDAIRRDPATTSRYLDCGTCMQTTPTLTRQGLACGYLPPAPAGVPVRTWDHPGRDPDRTSKLTTCPGFTCGLPEVLATSYARMHWKQNQLQVWARGKPTEQLVAAIETLEIASLGAEQFALENPIKRGA